MKMTIVFFALSRAFQSLQHPPDIVVYEFDHGVIGGLNPFGVEVFWPAAGVLKVDLAELRLRRQIALVKPRAGQGIEIEAVQVLPRRVEGLVRIKDIDAHQPRFASVIGFDEVNGAVAAPGRLMQLGRDVMRALAHLAEAVAERGEPIGIVVAFIPLVFGVVAPMKQAIAVMFWARLDAAEGAGQMKLARERAVVASLSQQRGDQWRGFRPVFVAIAAGVDAAGVHAGQEAGAARRADRALAIGAFEGDAGLHKAVDIWRSQLPVVERADRVVALLIGAYPKYIRFAGVHGCSRFAAWRSLWQRLSL